MINTATMLSRPVNGYSGVLLKTYGMILFIIDTRNVVAKRAALVGFQESHDQ
jgi:hypothetical protein